MKGLASLLVMMAVSACGDPAPREFVGHGVSFEYPGEWKTVTPPQADDASLWVERRGSGPGDFVALGAFRLPASVTDPIDLEDEVKALLANIASEAGGTSVGELEKIELAGLAGFSGTIHTEAGLTSEVRVAFAGDIEYFFSCQYTAEGAEETKRGCQQVLATLRLPR